MRQAAKSFDSRVGKEKAVRRSVAPASSMMARSRAQSTWFDQRLVLINAIAIHLRRPSAGQ